ncbi:MAG: 4-hydroxy-tetrahydrodipicolinate reductase [Actinobacteria bacterium]|nr:4-hydroxy-tetrahydrodipicolinate reductase [Actinomycetota bacterium]MCL5071966.1 4-hydroxy-tetrahydrodipicolinate reductase [Actinomycetota bacterium]
MKKIAMFGICGKMGTSMTKELLKEEDLEVVCGFDKLNTEKDMGYILGIGENDKKIFNRYEEVRNLNPDLIVDFTNAEAASATVTWALDEGMDIIVGTTGFKKDELVKIEKRANKSSSKVFIVPNFSIGAVLMIKISQMIAKYFDGCEIIELHHDKKKDAPSGTSISTAQQISQAKEFNSARLKDGEIETTAGSRGAFSDGIHIHSIRLPGLLAHQNVIFGTCGQTLSIKHDSIDRSSFYPGLLLAIRKINELPNYTYGLDKILDL